MRLATMNVWGVGEEWATRGTLIRDYLDQTAVDLVALQEVVMTQEVDQSIELLGASFTVVHQTRRGSDGRGTLLASRWPIVARYELDLLVTARVDPHDWLGRLLVAVVEAPPPVGTVVFASPKPCYQQGFELERELQAVLAAEHIQHVLEQHPGHVVVAGDLDATPEASSIRYWLGLQSLNGSSVSYHDSWPDGSFGDDPGFTYDPANPLVRGRHLRRGQRLDYILVRCNEHGPTLKTTTISMFLTVASGGPASDHHGVVADLEPM